MRISDWSSDVCSSDLIGPGPQTTRDLDAELDLIGRHAAFEMIAIGIGAHEVNAINAGLRHLIDRVATAATDADDANDRSPTLAVSEFKNFPCLSAHVLAPAPSRRSSEIGRAHV